MNNQVSILRRTMYQLSATCNSKRNEISYLQDQIQVLEGYVNGLKNRNQQQQEEIKTNPICEWSILMWTISNHLTYFEIAARTYLSKYF